MTNDTEKREAVLDQLVAEAQANGEYGVPDDEDGWIKHDGGPQPVADDVWVEVYFAEERFHCTGNAEDMDWNDVREWSILNQHLIDAAREEGIRLGLEVAEKYNRRAFDLIVDALQNANPKTIVKEAGLEAKKREGEA